MNHSCEVGRHSAVLDDSAVAQHIRRLKAVAHPVRLRMVDLMSQQGGELCVCEFEPHFGLTQPTISHHLRVLRDAGLVRSRHEATWVYHSIEPDAFDDLARLLKSLAADAAPE